MKHSQYGNRRFSVRLLTLLCALGLNAACLFAVEPVTLYVSPSGNDAWSGRLAQPSADKTDGPLASVQAARDAARRFRAAAPGAGVTILLAGGTYRLGEPLVLEPADSGTAEAPTVIAAAPGQSPVLSGGQVIRGWTKGEGGVWTAACPWAVGDKAFKQLWVNGRRRTRARTPNEGYFTIAAKAPVGLDPKTGKDNPPSHTAFLFAPGDVKKWDDLEQAVFVVFHSWETSLLHPASVDESARLVSFTGRAAWPFERWGGGQRYYVENVRAALDAPGEWCLDHKSGLLHYRPVEGEDMTAAQVVAPRLSRLVELRGDAAKGQLVQHVTLRGLTFSHQDYVLPPTGYSDAQAAVSVEAAVMADGARHCRFESCEVSHVGGYGLWLRRACKDCLVVRCRLKDLGAGGVRVGEAARAAGDELESSGNLVENNHIHDGGHVYAAGVGVWVAQSSHNRIRYNDIHDFNYSGMSVGWNWNDAPNRTHDNLIELNHVHHVMRGVLSDGGAIYTLGVSTGSVIRQNHFHDVWSYKQPPLGWGVYLDSTTSGYTVENNVVYNTTSGGFMCSNGGHENVVRNNVFALHANHTLWPYWHAKPNAFRRNIVYLTQGTLFVPFTESTLRQRIKEKQPMGDWDENLYWHTGGADELKFFRMDFSQWKQLGLDGKSVVADPKFATVSGYDFRLADDSPARKLGIESIDVSKAGLYGDAEWIAEAKRESRPPLPLPPPPPPPAEQSVADDFESTPVGAGPRLAVVSGQQQGASIAVSTERAAGGKQSLKVQDSAALEPAWQPHVYYEPHMRKGTVRQAFDVYLAPGCQVQVEWRDTTAYPQCIGPSIRLAAGAKADQPGSVSAAGKKLADLPAGRWTRIEIETVLGSRTYSLAVTPADGQRQSFADLPCAGGEFRELHWAGFISIHAADAAFYLDNMEIRKK
ncbi:MAG: hypothetical protein BWX88_01311 [Planctomycetes bacterium ADurb.Bin126]|nr:MAG: hypothetical protein BWX88_01311 [Planctomycetes bacterium ADurb.Bin126]HOD80841.1 right-handed parallel beta-helix repeat-containing protein [Phycisphaerae bacterium]HQL75675.1 right-handed parallel beta-helix repeat-containing protein [Phycisphaerae bacterium]